MIKKLLPLLDKARKSNYYLWLLNVILKRVVPFNKPHGLTITEIYDDGFKILLPFKRKNLNHVNGIHACGLATLSEYASGLALMMNLASDDFRLIMKNMSMTYHYQAKADVFITSRFNKTWMESNIFSPLKSSDRVFIEVPTEVHDVQQNLICTGIIQWQVKKWESVKTK